MSDFLRGDCHKCKFEITAECVPRSQKMGFPNCYQSTMTNADSVRRMSDDELADFINSVEAEAIKRAGRYLTKTEIERGKAQRLDWLRQEALP